MQLQERTTDPDGQVIENDRRYVLHSWSTQSADQSIAHCRRRGPLFLGLLSGKRYLDFASQLINSNIGHQHPRVVAAIKEQADRLCFVAPSFANDKRGELARLLAEVTPGDLEVSFFTNGGAEANENAIKMARAYTGRHKIIARYRSYHGATAGAVTLPAIRAAGPPSPAYPAWCACSIPIAIAAHSASLAAATCAVPTMWRK